MAKSRSVTVTLPRVVDIETDKQERQGYRLALRAQKIFPQSKEEGNSTAVVMLSATRGHGEATYLPRASVSPAEIDADFGRFGEIATRFEPSGPKRTEPFKGCGGGIAIRQRGWLVGKVDFRAEHGYTRLVAERLPGTWIERPRQSCTVRIPATRHSDDAKVTFEGLARRGHSTVAFSAERDRPGVPARLSAWTEERLGGVSISRSVEVTGENDSFTFDKGMTEAEVRPPAPFRGSALFATGAPNRTGTWLGSLSVSFPGRPDVRLAGDEFRGSLVSGSHCPFDPGAACIEIRGE